MKCYYLEPKTQDLLSIVQHGLEELLGKDFVVFVSGEGRVNTFFEIKEGSEISLYNGTISFPRAGTIAIIGAPRYEKICNSVTHAPVIPRGLQACLSSLQECTIKITKY